MMEVPTGRALIEGPRYTFYASHSGGFEKTVKQGYKGSGSAVTQASDDEAKQKQWGQGGV